MTNYIKYEVIVYTDGDKVWLLKGERHREDGPAEEHSDGTKVWYINGLRHREDGPAIECRDGTKFWYLNDELHREDGPAVEHNNGDKHWFLKGECLREEEFNKRMAPEVEMTMAQLNEALGKTVMVCCLGGAFVMGVICLVLHLV
jgi:hypothetical protein